MREVYVIGIAGQPDMRETSRAVMKRSGFLVSRLSGQLVFESSPDTTRELVEGIVVSSDIHTVAHSLVDSLKEEIERNGIRLTQDLFMSVKSSDLLPKHTVGEIPDSKDILGTYHSEN